MKTNNKFRMQKAGKGWIVDILDAWPHKEYIHPDGTTGPYYKHKKLSDAIIACNLYLKKGRI